MRCTDASFFSARNIFQIAVVAFGLFYSGHAGAATPDIAARDERTAVIFAYHRIGQDEYPSSNLRLEQFQAEIAELMQGGYEVLPLREIADALKSGAKMPGKAVALTFEGGHRSALENAFPLLIANRIPFTVFIATDPADTGNPDHLTWGELKDLKKYPFVTIGLHPASYIRLAGQGRNKILAQINRAKARFREELGEEPAFFAYPFGEYSLEYRNIVSEQGFTAAFGQQSGVAGPGADMFALPRFPMTEEYGDIERFRMAASALPLYVSDVQPADPLIPDGQPVIGFSMLPELARRSGGLSCFVSGEEKPDIEIVNENRVELRLAQSVDEERIRVNCTMPGPADPVDDAPRWRWFGLLLTLPQDDPVQTDSFSPPQDEPQ